jgi:hypothetical protein
MSAHGRILLRLEAARLAYHLQLCQNTSQEADLKSTTGRLVS